MPEPAPHPLHYADGDPFVERLRVLCARYPECREVMAHGRPTWRAGNRQFAIAGAAHQPEPAVVMRVDPDDRDGLLAREDVWVPAYDGAWGYLAITAGDGSDWALIAELVDAAYRQVANQRQLRALDADPIVPFAGE